MLCSHMAFSHLHFVKKWFRWRHSTIVAASIRPRNYTHQHQHQHIVLILKLSSTKNYKIVHTFSFCQNFCVCRFSHIISWSLFAVTENVLRIKCLFFYLNFFSSLLLFLGIVKRRWSTCKFIHSKILNVHVPWLGIICQCCLHFGRIYFCLSFRKWILQMWLTVCSRCNYFSNHQTNESKRKLLSRMFKKMQYIGWNWSLRLNWIWYSQSHISSDGRQVWHKWIHMKLNE